MANKAALLPSAKAHPFTITESTGDSHMLTEGEMVIENRAIAINPVDSSLQRFAWFPLSYPAVLGSDVAGVVQAVGSGVTRFKAGDRAVAMTLGWTSGRAHEGGFQQRCVARADLACPLPESIPFEQGAVIPLGLSAAACGLFQPSPFLALDRPTHPPAPLSEKIVVVWGASSSVGSNAVQLARAAGYEVVATASARNHDYVRGLGARTVLDYTSSRIGEELFDALKERKVAGALDCIGGEPIKIIADVLHRVAGGGDVRIASTKGGVEDLPQGVTVGRIFATTLKDNDVGRTIYVDYLPAALAAGSFVPAPEAEVVGHGLDSVQGAVDRIAAGVSATKLVVTL